MNIFDDILSEAKDRKIYMYDTYTPYFICSYACHMFNIVNQRKEIYWVGSKIPNLRLHMLMTAPPGYMKTFYLSQMGGDDYAILKNAGVDIVQKEEITEAAFTGTFTQRQGGTQKREGIAEEHKNGIITVDEFSGILNAFKATHNSSMESQMLSALDHGLMTKDMAGGKIQYKTNMTLWGGVQPTRIDMTAGLGRRFLFTVFIPTPEDNTNLKRAMHEARNVKPNMRNIKKLWMNIKKFNEEMRLIKKVEYDSSVLQLYDDQYILSHETSFYDKMMLGYTLTKYGPERTVTVNADDEEIINLINTERKWRKQVQFGIENIMIVGAIAKLGGYVSSSDLIDYCTKSGFAWTPDQIYRLLQNLSSMGIVKIGRNKKIEGLMYDQISHLAIL